MGFVSRAENQIMPNFCYHETVLDGLVATNFLFRSLYLILCRVDDYRRLLAVIINDDLYS
jgi:hypothetical protein